MAYIGPNTMSLNYTHMTDIRVSGKPCKVYTNTIMDLLLNYKNMSIFCDIVKRANYEDFLKNSLTEVTMFIPTNEYISTMKGFVDNMDILTARKLVQACMTNRKLCSTVIKASPIIYLTTKLPANRLQVVNMKGDTILNNNSKIVKFDIELDNGVIHVVNNIITPVTDSSMTYSAQTY